MLQLNVEIAKRGVKSTERCDKPTRKGSYINLPAIGMSPGQCWFVGIDPTTNAEVTEIVG